MATMPAAAAEGEAIVSSKLCERAKAGNITAMIFWLKSRADWRDTPDPAGVNVNLNARGETLEEEKARPGQAAGADQADDDPGAAPVPGADAAARGAAGRAGGQEAAGGWRRGTIQRSRPPLPVAERQKESANSPAMPLPGALFVGAK